MLTVLLAMGLTACGGGQGGEESKAPESQPESQQSQPESQGGQSQQSQGGQSQQSQGGDSSVTPGPQKDQTGHIWGADADVAGDAEAGTVTYKRAQCSENDGAVKLTVNQSLVTLDPGAARKSGTPDGYLKLNDKNQTVRFKFNYDKYAKVKFYLYCCMDGWKSNYSKQAFSYNGSPNIGVTVNEEPVDIAALSAVVYTDFLQGDNDNGSYSEDGYGCIGEVVLKKGVNEVTYTRLASMNVLVKDFVFVAEKEYDSEWGEPQVVAKDDVGNIAYTKYVSNLDADLMKVEWKAMDGTLADGSAIKSGTPDGFLKLDGNTQKMNYQFNFDADLDGQLYQRGAMDGYPGNASCTYFSQTKGAKYGNFEMKVNGSVVYYGDKRNVTYGQMLGTAAATGEASIGSGYSEIKDCLIGDAFLKNGANTASFERVDSYNLAINYFMFIGKKVAKAHVNPAADVPYAGQDADSHWQQADGDDFKFNRGEHHWVADTDETDTTSTCTVAGQKHYKCEICGMKKVEELELAAHTWVSDPDLAATDTESTCTTHGQAHMKCSVCGATTVEELPFGDHTLVDGTPANNSDGFAVTPFACSACNKVGAKMSIKSFTGNTKTDETYKHANDTTVTYKMIAPKAGNYQLKIGAYVKDNRTKDLSTTPYTVKVGEGDTAVNVPVSTGSYEELGIGGGSSVNIKQFILCPTITLAEGENVIAIAQGGGGYRLTFGGLVEIYEL